TSARALHPAGRNPGGLTRQHSVGAEHRGVGAEELGLSAGDRPRGAHLRRDGEDGKGVPHARDVCGDLRALSRAGADAVLARSLPRTRAAKAVPGSLMQLILDNLGLFAAGLGWTFRLAVVTLLIATVISAIIGTMSATRSRVARAIALVY